MSGPIQADAWPCTCNRRLSHLDPELQQFTMDARRAPQRVLHTHPPDQVPDLNRYLRPAAARTRLPSPIEPKTKPMPAQHSVRLDNHDGIPQRRKQPAQPNKEQSVSCRQPGPRGSPSSKHVQLMSQQGDLGFQLHLRAERAPPARGRTALESRASRPTLAHPVS
jgi:hypothetical protein